MLTDFIEMGRYFTAGRPFVKTPSPSMDILVSSNLERQLFELTDRNPEAVRGWMEDLRTQGSFEVDEQTRERMTSLYRGGSVDNETCLATIREVFEAHDYLIDPHTAVAMKVAEQLRDADVPVLVASTAHWAKFGNNVYRALHGLSLSDELPADVAALTGCQLNRLIADETGKSAIPAGLAELDERPIRFADTIEGAKENIEEAVCAFLEKLRA